MNCLEDAFGVVFDWVAQNPAICVLLAVVGIFIWTMPR
jgi:hypothetical protein